MRWATEAFVSMSIIAHTAATHTRRCVGPAEAGIDSLVRTVDFPSRLNPKCPSFIFSFLAPSPRWTLDPRVHLSPAALDLLHSCAPSKSPIRPLHRRPARARFSKTGVWAAQRRLTRHPLGQAAWTDAAALGFLLMTAASCISLNPFRVLVLPMEWATMEAYIIIRRPSRN